MGRLGQVDIQSSEALRWGSGEDGNEVWVRQKFNLQPLNQSANDPSPVGGYGTQGTTFQRYTLTDRPDLQNYSGTTNADGTLPAGSGTSASRDMNGVGVDLNVDVDVTTSTTSSGGAGTKTKTNDDDEVTMQVEVAEPAGWLSDSRSDVNFGTIFGSDLHGGATTFTHNNIKYVWDIDGDTLGNRATWYVREGDRSGSFYCRVGLMRWGRTARPYFGGPHRYHESTVSAAIDCTFQADGSYTLTDIGFESAPSITKEEYLRRMREHGSITTSYQAAAYSRAQGTQIKRRAVTAAIEDAPSRNSYDPSTRTLTTPRGYPDWVYEYEDKNGYHGRNGNSATDTSPYVSDDDFYYLDEDGDAVGYDLGFGTSTDRVGGDEYLHIVLGPTRVASNTSADVDPNAFITTVDKRKLLWIELKDDNGDVWRIQRDPQGTDRHTYQKNHPEFKEMGIAMRKMTYSITSQTAQSNYDNPTALIDKGTGAVTFPVQNRSTYSLTKGSAENLGDITLTVDGTSITSSRTPIKLQLAGIRGNKSWAVDFGEDSGGDNIHIRFNSRYSPRVASHGLNTLSGKYFIGTSSSTMVKSRNSLVGLQVFYKNNTGNTFGSDDSGLDSDFWVYNPATAGDNGTLIDGERWGGWELVRPIGGNQSWDETNGQDATDFTQFQRIAMRKSNVSLMDGPFFGMNSAGGGTAEGGIFTSSFSGSSDSDVPLAITTSTKTVLSYVTHNNAILPPYSYPYGPNDAADFIKEVRYGGGDGKPGIVLERVFYGFNAEYWPIQGTEADKNTVWGNQHPNAVEGHHWWRVKSITADSNTGLNLASAPNITIGIGGTGEIKRQPTFNFTLTNGRVTNIAVADRGLIRGYGGYSIPPGAFSYGYPPFFAQGFTAPDSISVTIGTQTFIAEQPGAWYNELRPDPYFGEFDLSASGTDKVINRNGYDAQNTFFPIAEYHYYRNDTDYSVNKSGVWNFKNLEISDLAEIKVDGDVPAGAPAGKNLVVFATESITFGKNSIINAQVKGTNSGRNDYDGWKSDGDVQEFTQAQRNIFTTGGGGGGGGRSKTGSRAKGGDDSEQGSSFRFTRDNCTKFLSTTATNIIPVGAEGGSGGGSKGGNGDNGSSVSTAVKDAIKTKFKYTMTGEFENDDGTIEIRDDFPFATGGAGGNGGTGDSDSSSITNKRGRGGHGGGCVILVTPKIFFPYAPDNPDNTAIPTGGYPENFDTDTLEYESDAAMIYVRGQTKSVGGSFDNATQKPGQDLDAVRTADGISTEEGVGGQGSGGVSEEQGMNAAADSRQASGSGGAGAGGLCVIVYNQLHGHPTIRVYGGLPGMRANSTRGGVGGLGGHGYMALGYKPFGKGDITWVKESNFGLKRGKMIANLMTPQYLTSPFGSAYGENYQGDQWPADIAGNGEYIATDS